MRTSTDSTLFLRKIKCDSPIVCIADCKSCDIQVEVNKSPGHLRVRPLSPASRPRRSAPTSRDPGGRRDRKSPSPTSTVQLRRRAGGSSPGTFWPGLRCVLQPPLARLRLHPRLRPLQQIRSVQTSRCLHLQPSCSRQKPPVFPLQLRVLVPPASTNCRRTWKMRLSRSRTAQRRRGEGWEASREKLRRPGGG